MNEYNKFKESLRSHEDKMIAFIKPRMIETSNHGDVGIISNYGKCIAYASAHSVALVYDSGKLAFLYASSFEDSELEFNEQAIFEFPNLIRELFPSEMAEKYFELSQAVELEDEAIQAKKREAYEREQYEILKKKFGH